MMLYFPVLKSILIFSPDLLHDLSMGQNVQNPWKRISAIPSSGYGAFNEDSFN